ncbi:MAG: helix-turn-helix transcriptional regulator [Clostridiales bacterium]|nr:helix-turn-helix transcriptional regulator [Clostridiales bacterium]
MSFSLDRIITTHTALPKNVGIVEIEPTAALSPYIRCFWKYNGSADISAFRIIPDCCADIIIPLDGSTAVFVGASDKSFIAQRMGDVFGIRFYAWAIAPFLHIGLSELFNNAVPIDLILNNFRQVQNAIIDAKNTAKQVELAGKYLLNLFDGRLCFDIINSLFRTVNDDCRVTVQSLSDYCAVSKRTLERKFIDNVGVSPKMMIDLLRYQMLWQDCLKSGFSAMDSAFKFGYYDEAHMLNDFKRYHGIGLNAARAEYTKLSHFYNTVTE